MRPTEDPHHEGNAAKYHSGKPCIVKGCVEPAGTWWGPSWCPFRARLPRSHQNLHRIRTSRRRRQAHRLGVGGPELGAARIVRQPDRLLRAARAAVPHQVQVWPADLVADELDVGRELRRHGGHLRGMDHRWLAPQSCRP